MNKIRLDKSTNFIIWEKYHLVGSTKALIIKFIDNGILDNNSQLLKSLMDKFIIQCNDFYTTLLTTIQNIDSECIYELKQYNIDFENRVYTYKFDSSEKYNKLEFALNTLNLKPSYMYIVQRLMDGEGE